ncbi:4Fe-4S single cluster domain-containing protein [Gorillibacterium sp. CAU 1737]|uniref:4Fe-4S single cluster domain-containing protein n=1 Tax=Gorillibacterium sp. CAU 1737 TaxID=3140362 RepID=UPI003260EF9D
MDKLEIRVESPAATPAQGPSAEPQPQSQRFTEDSLIRIADWVEDSITDGPGLRFTLFTQGCPHACPGCHNPQTHAVEGGRVVTLGSILDRIRANPLLDGVTLSGGDPFEQAAPLAFLAEKIHELGLNVITYTGYLYERLCAPVGIERGWDKLLDQTDLLVDGKYIARLRDPLLLFRGSSNQRILDMAETRRTGAAVVVEEDRLRSGCFLY